MFRNYLLTSWRNIVKNKKISIINILGLALGLACSLLILLWVQDELSYDGFHKKGHRIYKVLSDEHYFNGQAEIFQQTPANLAPLLQKEVPGIEHAIRFSPGWEDHYLLMYGEKTSKEKGCYADAAFLQLFSFPLVAGNVQTALQNPSSIVITQRLAEKYFKTENAVGKTISIKYLASKQNYLVTGVLADIPAHSSLQFDFVIPYQELQQRNEWLTKWGSRSIETYVLLSENTSVEATGAKMENFLSKHCKDCGYQLFLQPFTEMYLHSDFKDSRQAGGRIEYVHLFSVVAFFILLIACINFMNLSTARASTRAREVGVRKVIGADKKSLIGQFLSESLLITLLSMVAAISMVQLLLPAFNVLTGKNIHIPLNEPFFILTLAGIMLLTGLFAGSYPALFLSSFRPVQVLKGTLNTGSGNAWLRKGLVVFQFTLSTMLPIGTLVIYYQIAYIQSKNIGLNRENVLYLPVNENVKKHFEIFRTEILKGAAIEEVALSDQNPISITNWSPDARWDGKSPTDNTHFYLSAAGYDYIKTLGIQLKAGREFSRNMATDTMNYIINEEAARRMGMENPVGNNLHFWSGKGQIIGVMKDFHHHSMHAPIEPLIMMLRPNEATIMLVRTRAGQTREALASLQKVYKKFSPEYPFEYHFLEKEFEQLYKSETLISRLASYFTVLAIFISCLGLFGLVSFATVRRAKEIGVRKVLGASLSAILLLLSKDFMQLILLSNLIAWPLAYWGVYEWLSGYPYHIDIPVWLFIWPGLLIAGIALLTMSTIILKAAGQNPVKALRNE